MNERTTSRHRSSRFRVPESDDSLSSESVYENAEEGPSHRTETRSQDGPDLGTETEPRTRSRNYFEEYFDLDPYDPEEDDPLASSNVVGGFQPFEPRPDSQPLANFFEQLLQYNRQTHMSTDIVMGEDNESKGVKLNAPKTFTGK